MPGRRSSAQGCSAYRWKTKRLMPSQNATSPSALSEAGVLAPLLLVASREGFRADYSLPINMPGRGHAPASLHRSARAPELSHRLIGRAAVLDRIARRAVGFHGEPQPRRMRKVPHVAGVILHHQLRNRLPQIPQEPLGNLRVVHDPPRDHRQQREQVVAPPRLKFLAHLRRPVLRPVLPAINMRRHQPGVCRAALAGGIAHDLGHHPGEVGLNALLAQLVAFQAPPGFRSWGVLDPCARVPQPQHGPLSLGRVPLQTPVAVHARSEVEHLARG